MVEPRNQTRRIVIGAAVIVAVVACALLIFFLDELKRARQDTYRIVAVFARAPQLRPDAPVWIAGRAVGRVVHIEFLSPAPDSAPRVAAALELPTEVRSLVRRDSELRLVSERLLGHRIIDVSPGTAAAPALRPGDTLQAVKAAPLHNVPQEAARFGAALDSLLATASVVDALFRARTPAFGHAVRSLEAASAEFAQLAAGLERGPLARFLDDPGWRVALSRIRRAVAELTRAFAELANRGATTDRSARAVLGTAIDDSSRTPDLAPPAPDSSPAAAIAPALRRLVNRTKTLDEHLARLQSVLAQPNGFPSRLARDSAIAAALAGARTQLDSLVTEAKKRPWMFIF